jgi:hypothetical protein
LPSYLIVVLGAMFKVAVIGPLDAPWSTIVNAIVLLVSLLPYLLLDWVLGPIDEWRIRREWSVARSKAIEQR